MTQSEFNVQASTQRLQPATDGYGASLCLLTPNSMSTSSGAENSLRGYDFADSVRARARAWSEPRSHGGGIQVTVGPAAREDETRE